MTGLSGHTISRAYLDWNASAPLRPEAREAMLRAMDETGNPSSVHAEGRKAKAIVERARAQVADLAGCDTSQVIFTSGATEAAATVLSAKWMRIAATPVEHDCVVVQDAETIELDRHGVVHPQTVSSIALKSGDLCIVQAANSETGVTQSVLGEGLGNAGSCATLLMDSVQVLGKCDLNLRELAGKTIGLASAHKIGGPKGVGCILNCTVDDLTPMIAGGGQEQNRRAGTENVVGIAGFGAAAEAAKRDLDVGVWDEVANLRNTLETTLQDAAPDLTIFGKDAPRLPNTSCFAIPGWKGETQVMQMDLAGYAISAGSACSSGKVNKASRVLLAMGFDEITASSAIRVSIGPTTTKAELEGFASAWVSAYRRWKAKAA